jgi:TolB protein
MNADGSGRLNLTAGTGLSERGPDWSPDGAQFVFEVGNGSDNGELFLMDANSANRRSLGLTGRAPVWSPTGDRIAYMSDVGGRWQIYVYNVETGGDTPLPCPTQHCRFPEWSPDGNWVAVNDLVGGAPKTIYLLEASGGGAQQLTFDGAGNGRPNFSPDGRRIVFNFDGGSGTNGSAIYWMFDDGSSPRLVADLAGDDYQGDWR